MKQFTISILCALDRWRTRHSATLDAQNRASRLLYPQTWWYVPTRLRPVAGWLCGLLIGHELSDTEHGYGGGRMVDRWCRWCNKLIQVPIEESTWASDNAGLLGAVGHETEPEST